MFVSYAGKCFSSLYLVHYTIPMMTSQQMISQSWPRCLWRSAVCMRVRAIISLCKWLSGFTLYSWSHQSDITLMAWLLSEAVMWAMSLAVLLWLSYVVTCNLASKGASEPTLWNTSCWPLTFKSHAFSNCHLSAYTMKSIISCSMNIHSCLKG